jgi:uncharacterized protein (TIGR02145 family)
MAKQKAWIQYTKQGRIVPGSLILSPKRPVNGTWYEVIENICCDTEPAFGVISSRKKAFVKYDSQGNIVPGSLIITTKLPKPGAWKEVFINICCDITPVTTTTTTAAPTSWYLRSNYPDAPNNGDITFPDFTNGVATFNPNNVGNGDVGMFINRYDISGNPTIPDLIGLTSNLNTGTLTLSQGSNTIVYSFDGSSYIFSGFSNEIQIYYINIDSPASGDFNLIDPIDVSVTITFPTTTTSTTTSTTTTTTLNPNRTVDICSVNWVVQNLDVTTYRNGDVIPQVTDNATWASLTTGAWCYYNNDPSNGPIYGKLYNWYAVNDPRGLAPTGYHIPSDAELTILETCLGGPVAGNALKEAGTAHWTPPNNLSTNSSGFTCLPGGFRVPNGLFYYIHENASLWSSTEFNSTDAVLSFLDYVTTSIYYSYNNKASGFSVRLIKD